MRPGLRSVVPRGRGGVLSPRKAAGFSDPAAQWRGDSSIGTALRGGGLPPIERFPPTPRPAFDLEAAGDQLRQRFQDVGRHVVFEYYPWYGANPWRHWDEADRRPPIDIASNYMPRLGAYDSADSSVLERHAQWIAESGAGAVNLSWWGPGSDTDRLVPLVMDVMRAHDIHVTFHLEPYADRRTEVYARDILYLIREYGEKRHWDCFLLLEDAAGRSGPVFKSFRTILPQTSTDCHGVVHQVPDYTLDADWRRVTDGVRETLRGAFDHITLLADSLDFGRTPAAGFDGIAVYDNYVEPAYWRAIATECRTRGLLFSFNVNPGFDGIEQRNVAPDSCYRPPRFLPDDDGLNWRSVSGRVRAARLSAARIRESMEATVSLQLDSSLGNAGRGFFLTYINSFNEWHEGDQFEPMKDLGDLTTLERAVGYHNSVLGGYRMEVLRSGLRRLVG